MDEWSCDREDESCIEDFKNFDNCTSDSFEKRTNDVEENNFNLCLSSQISPRTMGLTGTERYFDEHFNVNIMKSETCNRESTHVKIPVIMDHFEESLDSKDMQDNQMGNAEITSKNLSSITAEFCNSQLQYLGYSLLHELLMML